MRSRLAAAFVSIILLMLVVQDLPLVQYLDRVEHNQIFTSLERDAWRLADRIDTSLGTSNIPAADKHLRDYAFSNASRVIVTDTKGIVIVDTDGDDLGEDFTNRPEIASGIDGHATTGERQSATLNDTLIYVAVPIEFDDAVVGVMRITYPGNAVNDIVNSRIRGVLLVGLFTLAITLFATIVIANAITRRVRILQTAAAEIASGNLTTRLTEGRGGGREIQQLEHTFNTMVERLSSLVDSQKSFASDASHQLRTPLTALRLRLENAADTIHDPEATAAALESASFEVVRLQMLIDGLLALARIEGSAPVLAPVEVAELIQQRIDMWQPLADEKNVLLVREGVDHIKVMATESSLDQMLDAYIENAIDFAPDNSTVEISVSLDQQHVTIHVIDQGPGMSSHARERAFDRFWRGRTDGSGTGLGLAIVRRLADSINATVALHSSNPDGTGIDAVIQLPRP
jgi:signal transduction histidine kinase